MNEEIREILARLLATDTDHLSSLADEDLLALDAQLMAAVDEARDARDVALVRDLVVAVQAVRTEADVRAQADETADSEIADVLAEITPDEEDAPEADEEVEAPEVELVAEDGDEAPEAPEVELEAVAAAAVEVRPLRPVIERLAARLPAQARPQPTLPEPSAIPGTTLIKAHADVVGFSAGSDIPLENVGHVTSEKMWALRDARGPASYPIFQVQTDYPSDRQLEEGETKQNTEKVNAIVSSAAISRRIMEAGGLDAINLANIRMANEDPRSGLRNELSDTQVSLVAAGGLCAPVAASYDLQVVAVADRPVRDSFPKFQAKRGGIRFITPPTLAGITTTGATAGVGIVTEAQDAASTTKTCLTITCGTEVEVVVDAIYMCLQVGNFSRMSFPEQFQAWYQLALAQHARVAEGNLLGAMSTNSTATTDGQNLGAARDLVEAYARAAAAFRSVRRMRPTAPLQVYLPFWVLALMKVDLLRQAPGDSTLAVTDALIASMWSNHYLSVTWYLDERSGAGQIFAAQGVAPLIGWPATVEGYITHPGAFTFLDMGTLDFGTEIRDTTMISQNNMRAFMETFENLAYQGVGSLRVRSTICPSGAASALVTYTCPGAGS